MRYSLLTPLSQAPHTRHVPIHRQIAEPAGGGVDTACYHPRRADVPTTVNAEELDCACAPECVKRGPGCPDVTVYCQERLAVGCFPHLSYSGDCHGLGVNVADWSVDDIEDDGRTGLGCALVGQDLRGFGNLIRKRCRWQEWHRASGQAHGRAELLICSLKLAEGRLMGPSFFGTSA